MASIFIIGGGEDLVSEVLGELISRGHDPDQFRLLNSSGVAGEFVAVGETRFRVEAASAEALAGAEAAIFLGDGLLARDFAPELAERGTLVVDASP